MLEVEGSSRKVIAFRLDDVLLRHDHAKVAPLVILARAQHSHYTQAIVGGRRALETWPRKPAHDDLNDVFCRGRS